MKVLHPPKVTTTYTEMMAEASEISELVCFSVFDTVAYEPVWRVTHTDFDAIIAIGDYIFRYLGFDDVSYSEPITNPSVRQAMEFMDRAMREQDSYHYSFLEDFSEPTDRFNKSFPVIELLCGS
jgi:hypothetical protein